MTDIIVVLKDVARWRRQVQNEKEGVAVLDQRLRETPEWLRLNEAKTDLDFSKSILEGVEAEARDAILAAYRETGSKKPAEGAGVRVTRKARYDLAVATAWAQASAPALMVLDAKAFEKANLPGAPIEWEEAPTATIATDLSMYEDEVTA